MPRTARVAPGGMVFHVLNRANAWGRIFAKDADYAAFERVMEETVAKKPMRILGYLMMPNHWHLVLWPQRDGDLAQFREDREDREEKGISPIIDAKARLW